MVAIIVTRNFRMTDEERRALRNMEPRAMEAFMVRQGRVMVQQARKNIRTFGTKASSVWPKLSTAYAKAKRKGWTPGRGANKYAMLRDTGYMYASLVGLVSSDGRGRVSVALDATGTRPGGPTNADLLRYHHKGSATLPRRSPVQDMSLFERQFAEALRLHLSGAR